MSFSSATGGPSITGGPQQLIDGIAYTIGSPEYTAALNAQKIKNAGVAGTAAGTAASQYDIAHPSIASQEQQAGFYANGARQNASTSGLSGLVSALTSGMTGAGAIAPPTLNTGAPAPVSTATKSTAAVDPVAPVDMTAANAAVFGAAKDQVGQETSGALTGLRSALGGRGMLGSGAESRGTAATINTGQGELGAATRQNAMTDAAAQQQTAQGNQTAAVTQRGQDFSANAAAEEAALTARGQDITAQNDANQTQLEKYAQEQSTRQTSLQGLISALTAMGGLSPRAY